MDQAPQPAPPGIQSFPVREGLRIKLAETSPEWAQIKFLFDQWGEAIPDSRRAVVAIALDAEDRVIALQVMQFVLHAEPLWVAPEWRGKFNVLRLVRRLEEHLSSILPGFSYFILATRRNVEKLAALAGMQIIGPGVMFRKDIGELAKAQGERGERGEVA